MPPRVTGPPPVSWSLHPLREQRRPRAGPPTKVTKTTDGTAVLESPTTTSSLLEITTPASSPAPGHGGGGGLSGELKVGLGLGLGIGIPLIVLLGLGCFFLWRLWRRQRPRRGADSERRDRSGEGANTVQGFLEPTKLYEVDGRQHKGPKELQSTEIYEAEGGGGDTIKQKVQPVELGI
ncbi:hypothetical protein PG993_012451 [Apiospora rasikravindrae]|uniref:Uncharacterized protein n=1 Tax=Apiospora rasikravindrae TaxID=990691 RepID=A0ABR1S2M4_9PEZI